MMTSFSDFDIDEVPDLDTGYPCTTSGYYDWEADIVEKHAIKEAESKKLFRDRVQ